MQKNYVVPKMKEAFGELEFLGDIKELQRATGTGRSRRNVTYALEYIFMSSKLKTNVEVIVPATVPRKVIPFEATIKKVINPELRPEIRRGFNGPIAEVKLYVDDFEINQ